MPLFRPTAAIEAFQVPVDTDDAAFSEAVDAFHAWADGIGLEWESDRHGTIVVHTRDSEDVLGAEGGDWIVAKGGGAFAVFSRADFERQYEATGMPSSAEDTLARIWNIGECILGPEGKCPDDDPPKCPGCRATEAEAELARMREGLFGFCEDCFTFEQTCSHLCECPECHPARVKDAKTYACALCQDTKKVVWQYENAEDKVGKWAVGIQGHDMGHENHPCPECWKQGEPMEGGLHGEGDNY